MPVSMAGDPSQSFKDITDDYYLELRKPKQIVFFINGQFNYIWKILNITPNRFFIFSELLDYLTKHFIRYIPTGVRRIFDKYGIEVTDLDDLENHSFYTCSGTESFRPLDYDGKYLEIIRNEHSHKHSSHLKFFYTPQEPLAYSDSFQPSQTPLFYRGNRLYPIISPTNDGNTTKPSPRSERHLVLDEKSEKPVHQINESNQKPKILTIIRNGNKPHSFFKILLNKHSSQSYKDLLSDISEAFGPNWKEKPIQKIYTASGKEVREIGDLFKSDNYFVAVGENESNLNEEEAKKIVKETFPDYEQMNDQDMEYKPIKNDKNNLNPVSSSQMDKVKIPPNTSRDVPPYQNIKEQADGIHNHSSNPMGKEDKSQNNKRKYNNTKKRPVIKYPNKMENPSHGYPYNDSRKPGPFEMFPEDNHGESMPTKLRAKLFGLERIRAGLEERELARQTMARKLEQESSENDRISLNYPNKHLRKYQHPSNENGAYLKKPQNSRSPFDKYKNSPYLESLGGHPNRGGDDRRNWLHSKNKTPNGNSTEYDQKAKPHWRPNSLAYPYQDDDYDYHLRNPNSERIPTRKPFNKGSKSKTERDPQIKMKPKSNRNGNPMYEERKSTWERIPPLNFPKPTSRIDWNTKFLLPDKPTDVNLSSLSPVNEEDDNLKSNVSMKTFESPPIVRNVESSTIANRPFSESSLKLSISPHQILHDSKAEKANQYPESELSKLSNTIHSENGNTRPNKTSLSSLIGRRSETVNISNIEKSFQKPTRTKKQSMVVQNPSSARIVPRLAKQLKNNEEFDQYYSVGTIIGTGNFSQVKEAKKKGSGKPFAAKIIEKKMLKDKEDLIEEEIRILKSCKHPNIIRLEEEYESPDRVYLIQELMKEGDLFDAICEHIKFPESHASVMMRDIFRALLYLHSRGIAHRDIKPENLLCSTKNGIINLKLADFGLAIDVKEPLYVICGTPTYVSPEILTEEGYGIEVDIWAAGVICYILLSGFPPFRSPDRNQTELFEFIKAGEFDYLKPYWDGISEDAKDLINHMLVVDPTKRYTVLDCLCHRWTITLGNSIKFTKPLTEVVDEARVDLQIEAAMFKSHYENSKDSS